MTDSQSPELQKKISLKPYNTLGVDAHAARFISVNTKSELLTLLGDESFDPDKTFILGGGSNVLFVDDFDGLVLHMAIRGIEKVEEDEEHVWIRSGAGQVWHNLVTHCVEQGWGGVENLSLIPGTAGAAPIQNIGAYGVELRDLFVSLEAVNIETGEPKTFNKEECRFGYRDSIFKNELKGAYIITHVTLKLSKQPTLNTTYGAIQAKLEEKGVDDPTIHDVSQAVIEIRQSKLPDPQALGNAGSFFKNPILDPPKFEQLKQQYPGIPSYPLDDGFVKVPAGWLIEETGWKGKVVGNAGVYRNQALVIVNHGGATGREILELARSVQASVKQKFGIELDPEVNIIS